MRQRADLKQWFLRRRPESRQDGPGVFISGRILMLFSVGMTCLFFLQTKEIQTFQSKQRAKVDQGYRPIKVDSIAGLRSNTLRMQGAEEDVCRFYLAESAIPHGGLGMFTATGLHPGDMVGFPDICIFVGDAPKKWTHMRSHTFGRNFFGQSEGSNSRAACEGFATTFNTNPDHMINTELVSPVLQTNAGLNRARSPGAGSITHHYGMHARATDLITAGSELTIYYGDWDFDKKTKYSKLERPVSWLQEHGWCVDNIRVGQSSVPDAGRGAFAERALKKGQVVAPAPLQCYRDREVFQKSEPEQLYVNYCIQPKNSKMIFFPYGPGVNLINHSSQRPNVEFKWSTNHMHHATWLDLSYDEFWKVTSPGGLVLDVVAIRDIEPGEELLLNYGSDWEAAWKNHVKEWEPPEGAEKYVYPVEMDETEPLRTVEEQKTNPYPENLATVCSYYKRSDGRWKPPKKYCHILDRKMGANGDPLYTVSLIKSRDPEKLAYDESVPKEDLYIVEELSRSKIRFVERPYMDDEHLPGAFRHPIELPEHLVPEAWKDAGDQQSS